VCPTDLYIPCRQSRSACACADMYMYMRTCIHICGHVYVYADMYTFTFTFLAVGLEALVRTDGSPAALLSVGFRLRV
jgi:hypothetical protein